MQAQLLIGTAGQGDGFGTQCCFPLGNLESPAACLALSQFTGSTSVGKTIMAGEGADLQLPAREPPSPHVAEDA